MAYYDDALEWQGTAIDMADCGRYRASVYMSCLAVDTQEFTGRFLDIVDNVKEYIDTHCIITKEDLLRKFGKKHREA